MGILTVVLLVFFVAIAVLLILLVLVQNEEGDSLGGIFAGGSGSAFGSRSGNVLTRATSVLGALFLIVSLSLALIRAWENPVASGVEEAGREQAISDMETTWMDDSADNEDTEGSEDIEGFDPSLLFNNGASEAQ